MTANRLMAMRAHPSASPIRVDDTQTVPSYLQRYAAELNAWHEWRVADGYTMRPSTSGPHEGAGTQ